MENSGEKEIKNCVFKIVGLAYDIDYVFCGCSIDFFEPTDDPHTYKYVGNQCFDCDECFLNEICTKNEAGARHAMAENRRRIIEDGDNLIK